MVILGSGLPFREYREGPSQSPLLGKQPDGL